MAYSDFTLAKVREAFNLTLEETQNLFSKIAGVPPSDLLRLSLNENISLATAINTEKARSEFLIVPILAEVRRQLHFEISLFSGVEFNVDSSKGLTGFCDFLLSCAREQYYISAPVIAIVEAKNESIKDGLGRCIASMIAAQLFNQTANNGIEHIYGAVTSGTNWKFLKLQKTTVFIDSTEYYINEVDRILGILLAPIQLCLAQT